MEGAEQDRDAGTSIGHRPAAPAAPARVLLAGQLPVEAGEGDGEGLHGAERVVVVHGEGVVRHAPELHHDVVGCRREGERLGCHPCTHLALSSGTPKKPPPPPPSSASGCTTKKHDFPFAQDHCTLRSPQHSLPGSHSPPRDRDPAHPPVGPLLPEGW